MSLFFLHIYLNLFHIFMSNFMKGYQEYNVFGSFLKKVVIVLSIVESNVVMLRKVSHI